MAETTENPTTEQDETPAPKKRTTRKAAPKPPSIDQALDTITTALADENSPEAAQINDALGQLLDQGATDLKVTNVYTAILAVMREVKYVGKNGVNEEQRYKFRGIDDVINALGPAMRRHGLLLFPKVQRKDVERYERNSGGSNRKFSTAVQVDVTYRFQYALGGPEDHVDVEVVGESIDTSDKATAKAMSVALRIALLQTFALPTYDEDPDQHNPELEAPQPLTPEQLKDACMFAINKNEHASYDDGFKAMRAHFGDARLEASYGVTKDGERLPGPAYMDYVKARAEQLDRDQAAAAQDQAAHGDTREQDAPAHDARAQQPEQATQPAQEPRADQAPAERAPQDPQQAADQMQQEAEAARQEAAKKATEPRKSKDEVLIEKFGAELEFQAESLGQDVGQYAASILATKGDLSSIIKSRAPKFLVSQRPAVINALREKGMGNVAAAYESFGNGCPMVMDVLWEKVDAEDRATQPQQQ